MVLDFVLTSFIVCSIIGLGLLVYFKNRHNQTNRLFAILTFWMVVFIASNFLENEPIGLGAASLSLRLDFASASFLVYFWLLFCLNFPQPASHLPRWKQIVLFVPAMLFAFSSFSPLVINNIRLGSMGINFGLGPLYPFYVIYIVGYMLVGGCGNLVFKYRKARGIERAQIFYVLLGLSISASIGVVFNLFLQRVLPIELFRIGIYGAVFIIVFTAYAIVKYRLMDIRIAIKEGTVYLASFVVVIGFAVAGMVLFIRVAGEVVSSRLVVVSCLILVLTILVFGFVRRRFERIANKYLFVSLYNYQEAIRSLGQQLTRTIDLNKIIETIVETTTGIMKLDGVGVLLRNKAHGAYQVQKIIGFKEDNDISLLYDNFLIEYLQKTIKPLVGEELNMQIRDTGNLELKNRLQNLRDNMKKNEIAVCLPLFHEATIQGLIVLGNKVSGDPYSTQDIGLLEVLAAQASMALNNALLYEDVKIQKQEVEKRKVDLERFYALTVGRELKMIELKDRLKQLEMNTKQEI